MDNPIAIPPIVASNTVVIGVVVVGSIFFTQQRSVQFSTDRQTDRLREKCCWNIHKSVIKYLAYCRYHVSSSSSLEPNHHFGTSNTGRYKLQVDVDGTFLSSMAQKGKSAGLRDISNHISLLRHKEETAIPPPPFLRFLSHATTR